MKGEERLWTILNDKLDTLRATNQLPEAIRVAETALEIAKRAFKGNEVPLATSFEKLGQLLEQKGDYTNAEANLLKAHANLDGKRPPSHAMCVLWRFMRNNLAPSILMSHRF